MTAQDRELIEHALRDRAPKVPVVVRIEALIEQARAEERVDKLASDGLRLRAWLRVHDEFEQAHRDRLIAALLRSRRTDRAVIRAVSQMCADVPGIHPWDPSVGGRYEMGRIGGHADVFYAMAAAERTAREENHRG